MAEDQVSFEAGYKAYLVHQGKSRFYEIANLGSENHIRYGRLSNGSESKLMQGTRNYNDSSSALMRAKELIFSKKSKGYTLHRKENTLKPKVKNSFTSLISRNLAENADIELDLS